MVLEPEDKYYNREIKNPADSRGINVDSRGSYETFPQRILGDVAGF
jgi:hypothetical protein